MDRLSKKQLAVIEDLFAGELDEAAVLQRHKVSRRLYNKWLADEGFVAAFAERIGRAYRQSQLIIARYAPLAAAKLVQLTESDSAETARKACLDIISNPAINCGAKYGSVVPVEAGATSNQPRATSDGLSAETASRLLAALAETDEGRQTTQDG
jgi:hypothetical protein